MVTLGIHKFMAPVDMDDMAGAIREVVTLLPRC
jgi:hypothetical protein